MDCRTTPSIDFKSRIGFNQHDPIMAQEQSILSKIVTLFAAEKIILQHHVLGYYIDAYFSKYKFAIEINELGHKDRDIHREIQRQNALEQELGCEFIRINPAKENFIVLVEICKIQNYIVESTEKMIEGSTKKYLVDDLSNKLLRLEFKSDNFIKTKCLKYVVKKILPTL